MNTPSVRHRDLLLVLVLAAAGCGSSEGLAQRTPPHRDFQSSAVTPRKPEPVATAIPTPPDVATPVRATEPVPPVIAMGHVTPHRIVEPRPGKPARVAEPIPEEPVRPDVRRPEVDCDTADAVGYRKGKRIPIKIVRVDGSPVEQATANAFLAMAEAAAKDGVELTIYSAFRSPEEQEYFYQCWQTCSCNGCSKAAKPGFSNHQMGKALDIAIWSPDVHPWLAANAKTYGFAETVAGEPWHWEFKGTKKKGKKSKAPTGVCK